MAYCVTTDIEGEIKGAPTFSATTSPTETVLTEWISQAGAEIDGLICQKYTTPITGTNALLVIKRIAIDLVKGRLEEFWQIKTGDTDKDQGKPGQTPRARALKMLEQIQEGTLDLSDATKADVTDGVRSYALEDDSAPVFEQGVDQW